MTRSRQTADWGSRAGLAKIVPSSVAVGSGTGSASALGTVTFSGASSVSLDGVFNSTYDNYRVIFNYTPSASAGTFFYFRNGSGNITTSNYFYKGSSLSSVSSGVTWTNDTFGRSATAAVIDFSNANRSSVILDISDAFSSSLNKVINIKNSDIYADAKSWNAAFQSNASTTGFNFTMGSGTMTGTISVYGYTN
jgi:hypothetical protein